MSQHRSLKGASTITAKRNVLKRFERVELLKKRGQWKEGGKVVGLPKTKPDVYRSVESSKPEAIRFSVLTLNRDACLAPLGQIRGPSANPRGPARPGKSTVTEHLGPLSLLVGGSYVAAKRSIEQTRHTYGTDNYAKWRALPRAT
jgi:small basic protein (TIGR04137 family)